MTMSIALLANLGVYKVYANKLMFREEYKEMIQNPRKILIEWDKESETFLECWFGNDTEPRKKQLKG